MATKKIISGEEFDNLQWEDIDQTQLLYIIMGLRVCDVDLVDYPLTDGVIIYLIDQDKKIIAVSIQCRDYPDEDDNPLYFQMAKCN